MLCDELYAVTEVACEFLENCYCAEVDDSYELSDSKCLMLVTPEGIYAIKIIGGTPLVIEREIFPRDGDIEKIQAIFNMTYYYVLRSVKRDRQLSQMKAKIIKDLDTIANIV